MGHINLHIFFLAHLNHEQFLNMICISHFHLNLNKDSWTNDSAHLQLLKKTSYKERSLIHKYRYYFGEEIKIESGIY